MSFFCRFGWHSWLPWQLMPQREGMALYYEQRRECRCCGRVRWTNNHKGLGTG